MAEEAKDKKESKGSRRYGSGPKVKPKAPAAGAGEAKETAEKPVAETPGAAPEATAANGADGIPVTERHGRERMEMGERHTGEMMAMHKRHQKEHSGMIDRQMEEAGGAMGAGDAEAGAA